MNGWVMLVLGIVIGMSLGVIVGGFLAGCGQDAELDEALDTIALQQQTIDAMQGRLW